MTSPRSEAEVVRPGKIAESLIFAGQFLRHGKKVASLVPSSKPMARRLSCEVDPARPQVIVELGTGTGVVTETAIARMHPDSRLVAFERNAKFAEITANRCPRATVLCRDAAHFHEALAEMGVDRVDVVINCLPTPSLPAGVNEAIFRSAASVMDEVRMTQLTEIPMYYFRLYRRLFHRVRFTPVVRNFPPAGVYHLRGLRSDFVSGLPNRA